jgi:DNA-binding LytR/AlgR family response regulator
MSAPLRVLAVDDEPPALADLVWALRRDPRVGDATGAESAAAALRLLESAHFDALFLDVRMPGLDGLDIARLLGRFEIRPAVVFVTAYEQFAVDAFELAAVDYLLKPVDGRRLTEALDRVVAARSGPVPRSSEEVVVAVEQAGRTLYVRRDTVQWVEAHGDYVRLHTAEGNHLVRIALTTLERDWADAGFVRIHRSLLVSLPQVEELRVESGHTTVRLGGAVLTVSRRHAGTVRELLARTRSRR